VQDSRFTADGIADPYLVATKPDNFKLQPNEISLGVMAFPIDAGL
jgi:hypothetical protein